MSYRSLIWILLIVVAIAVPAKAQMPAGIIAGRVVDSTEAALPGVTITLQGADAARTFMTDGAGNFRFLDLEPGVYRLTSALTGFATGVRDGLVLDYGKSIDLTIVLQLSAVQETVDVSASPMVDTRETGTPTNFTADELTMIPTSRDPFSLMRTVPGLLVDRVNIGGNETGQQPNFVAKGTRPQDAVWTMDGVVITDMTLTGTAPTYFNYDNFEAIQVTTTGQDIAQQTGGPGLNFVVKRGQNVFHGGLRGYFGSDAMESSNVPDELKAAGVTPETADHTDRLSDWGGELGGPILKDRAWFYASYSVQDIKLFRRTSGVVDRTQLKNPNLKVNWQATPNDMFSLLYFNGSKVKEHRSPGTTGITTDAPTATFHQDNAYTDTPLHGLFKLADDHVFGSNLFVSGKYAYYNTGFLLTPEGGMDLSSGRDLVTGTSYGSTVQSENIRPQMTVNIDANSFATAAGATHDIKYGVAWRRVNATTRTLWPGNGILSLRQTPTQSFAQLFREGSGTNQTTYTSFYLGDTIALGRATVDLGLRYDQQGGAALASQTAANPAFPDLVPGLVFAGYDAPFTWRNWSPRVGLTYALDAARKTLLRANYSRYAGQLDSGSVGYRNPASSAGVAVYRWSDLDGDHLASAGEVLTSQFVAVANGFNRNDPTAVTSSNHIDPNLEAPITQSAVVGIDRELMADLSVQVDYTYTKTTNLIGNNSWAVTPRVSCAYVDGAAPCPIPGSSYSAGPTLTGALPDGAPYSVNTFIAPADRVSAGGGGFLLSNWGGNSTDYHGVEVSLVKRLSKRWMGRVSFGYNNAREHIAADGRYDTNGNPTPTLTEPLVDGGQFAPQSTGLGNGNIYVNAKWQFNANAMYQAPYGFELAANVFGRQGYPFPLYRNQRLGSDTSLNILVTPRIDSFRYDNVWDTDLRIARPFALHGANLRLIADLFNVFNANTALVRNNNLGSDAFNTLAVNLSPRVLRLGVVVGF
ncbi:MAG: TonB-dependent receptor [Acidobacteria bacterium]|nr:TonB-dependent receptor [Acidobacteriota bacterium]